MEYQTTHSQSPSKPPPVNGRELDEPVPSMSTLDPKGARKTLGIEYGAAKERAEEEDRRHTQLRKVSAPTKPTSPFRPGRNTLVVDAAPAASSSQGHGRSTHGQEPNPERKAGRSRLHGNPSPSRLNGSPDNRSLSTRRAHDGLAEAPQPKRPKVHHQPPEMSKDDLVPRSRERRKRPPEVDVFEVQSSEDEHKHTKRSPGFPSASGSTRDLTTSRSASPQKKPPGQYRLISPSPEADDEEDIEQFSSPPEAGPSKAQKVSASRELSQFKVASSGERRPKTKQAMKKKDGSVPEPAPIAVAKAKKAMSRPSPPDERSRIKPELCFSGDRPILNPSFTLHQGTDFLTLFGKAAAGTQQESMEIIRLDDIDQLTWCLKPPMMLMLLAPGSVKTFESWVSDVQPKRGMILPDDFASRETLKLLLTMTPKSTTLYERNSEWEQSLKLQYAEFQKPLNADGSGRRAGPSRTRDGPSQKAFEAAERRGMITKVLNNGRKPQRRGSEEYHEPLPADRRKVKGKAPADEPKQTKLEFSSPFTARRSTRATRLQERVNDPSDSDEPLETEPPPRAKTPRPDRNEVLFGWPLEGRSDVQVTKGDKYRLDEGDFLNDNFLDFGLRFTLHDDSAIPPEVRDKVHMFNSFFYDKLSKKDKGSKPVDGEWPAYDSVKKWTKMANIFDKDYVIVPINESLHWFLAVIFNPRGILKKRDPPLESEPAEVPRRRATRRSVIRPGDSDTTGQQSPSKSPDHQPLSPPKHVDSEDPLDVIDDQSYEDHGEIEKVSSQVDKMTISRKGTPDNPSPQPIKSFTLESFYAQDRPASTKADTEQAGSPAPKGPAKKPRREDCDLLAGDKTYILLLDSLGGTHKAVGNNLKRWLQFEARDKLPQSEVPDVEDMSDSVYLDAKVIEQPNSSDCGVFLIHYVRCLLSDPRSVLQFIGKGPPHRNEEDPAYTAELDAVWRRLDTERLRGAWAETLDDLTAKWNSLHDVPSAPAQGMNESTTSVTAMGDDAGQLPASHHSPALSGGVLTCANNRPTILSPSPPATPNSPQQQLPTSAPRRQISPQPFRMSPEKSDGPKAGQSPTGSASSGEKSHKRGSSQLYKPVDLEQSTGAPPPKRTEAYVEIPQHVPGGYPLHKGASSSASTPGPSRHSDEGGGGTTPLHHAVEAGALPRMMIPTTHSAGSSRNTPSDFSASDKENAVDKENERRRQAASPDSTLSGPTGSPPPRTGSVPRSIQKRLAAAKLQRTDPVPARIAERRVSPSVAPKGPQKKRRKQSEAARADSGMTVDQAINIDSDSGGEH